MGVWSFEIGEGVRVWGLRKFSISVPLLPINFLFVPLLPVPLLPVPLLHVPLLPVPLLPVPFLHKIRENTLSEL